MLLFVRNTLVLRAQSKREILELIEEMEAFGEAVEVVMKTRFFVAPSSDDMVLDVADQWTGRGAGYEQHEAFCEGREEVWNSGAFSGRNY